jgi:hypothetical protein
MTSTPSSSSKKKIKFADDQEEEMQMYSREERAQTASTLRKMQMR